MTVAGLRATEYTFIVVAGVLGGVPLWLVYTLLLVLTLYHYDVTGRIEKQATPVRGEAILRGWDIRVTVLAITVAIGWAVAAYAVAAIVIGGVFVIGALVGWRESARSGAAAVASDPIGRALEVGRQIGSGSADRSDIRLIDICSDPEPHTMRWLPPPPRGASHASAGHHMVAPQVAVAGRARSAGPVAAAGSKSR